MTKTSTLLDPKKFDLTRFADLLALRVPIVGEGPLRFDGFHAGVLQSLAPATPYEHVIAEHLIAIEWELMQHRRMREKSLRGLIREAIKGAVKRKHYSDYNLVLDADWDEHVEAGGNKDDWEAPFPFDSQAAHAAGEDLAARAVSSAPDVQEGAYDEILQLGMDPLDLMGEAYLSWEGPVLHH